MKRLFLIGTLSLAFIAGCNAPEHGAGQREVAGPYIAEAVLASGLAQNGYPIGITDEFSPGSDVYLWILWENFDDLHKVNVVWLNPGGNVYVEDSVITAGDGVKVTFFHIGLSMAAMTGEWEVEIYLDDEFRRSLYFHVY